MVFAKTWSKIENLTILDISDAMFPNNVCNLGIHEYKGELYTSGYVGVTRLVDRFGRVLKDCNNEDIILCVTQGYNIDPFEMLSTVMSDEEYFAYCDSLARDKKELFTIFDNQPLVEAHTINLSGELLLCVSFIKNCVNVCNKQLKSQMLTKHDNMHSKVKGKIDLKKHLKYNVFRGHEDRVYCKYNEFTFDIVENQILKFSLEKIETILRKKYPRAYDMFKREIGFCKSKLRYVSDVQISSSDFSRVKINGFYSFYKPSIKFAKMMLKNRGLQIDYDNVGQSNEIAPYAINMEALFEFYIRAKIKEFFKDCDNISIARYNKRYHYLTDYTASTHLMKNYIPDVVIEKDGIIEMVLDVKYKRRLLSDRHDTHQIMSYAFTTNTNKCGFIFPNEDGTVGLKYDGSINIIGSENIVSYYEFETSVGNECFLKIRDILSEDCI